MVLRSLPGAVDQRERAVGDIDFGVQLEERLVDRPQLLGAEVAEVDGAKQLSFFDVRERT